MRGKRNIYGIKAFGLEVKDLDPGSRQVKGYLSAFNKVDSDFDRIHEGAFAKSISERGPNSISNRKIAHLRQHDWNQQIGKFLELEEDSFGLKFVSQLGRSTKGEDALLDYQDGIIKEHSIGFRYISEKMEYDEDANVWEIKELNLFEGSAVTFGANEFTPVIDVAKGEEGRIAFEELQEEMTAIIQALKNGKGTDDRLYRLEMRLTALQAKFDTLFTSTKEPLKDSTLARKEEEEKRAEEARMFYLKMLTQ